MSEPIRYRPSAIFMAAPPGLSSRLLLLAFTKATIISLRGDRNSGGRDARPLADLDCRHRGGWPAAAGRARPGLADHARRGRSGRGAHAVAVQAGAQPLRPAPA